MNIIVTAILICGLFFFAGGAVGSLIAGYAWAAMGPSVTFAAASMFAVLGAVVAWRFIDNEHDF